MSPPEESPEYSPRPGARRAPARAGAAGAKGGPQAATTAWATLAIMAGVVWFAGTRGTPTPGPATPEPPAVEIPATAPPPTEAPAPPPAAPLMKTQHSMADRMNIVREADPPIAAATGSEAAPQPVTAPPQTPAAAPPRYIDDSSALRPQAQRMSAAQTSRLFNKQVGWFVPYKDQPERHIAVGAAPRAPATAQTPAQAAAPAPGANEPCEGCIRAIANSGFTDRRPNATVVGGTLQLLGRCKDGAYIYQLTNTSARTLNPTAIAPNGEVWNTGGLKPSQSVEIRSREPIPKVVLTR